MQIEKREVRKLAHDPNNARTHDRKNIEAIKGSLAKFGQQKPIVIDKGDVVIAGNGTLEAARELGWETIDVVVTTLDKFDKTAFALADNQTGLLSDWNDDVLDKQLKALTELDFDITEIGFDLIDLDKELAEPSEKDDQVPELEDDNPYGVELGDIWQLGNHRIMCGDSTVKENVDKLMDGQKADMVFTDPPYNHASKDKLLSQSVRQSMKKLSEAEWDKNFNFKKTFEILDIFKNDNSTIYICTSWHLAGEIWEWMAKHSTHYSYCVWHKPNPMPSLAKRHWTWSSELICYATYGKHTFNFPEEGHASNVWSINKNAKNDLHPTMKPVDVPVRAIEHSSNKNKIVLDLFLGSGSTLIACEKTNRKAFGLEIDPHYCSVIIKRWEEFTGEKASKL